MKNFINQNTEYSKRKLLEVIDVTKNETGEIDSLLVDENSELGEIYEMGTPLNAISLTEIIEDLIEESRISFLDSILTDEEKVKIDIRKSALPCVVLSDFELPSKGYLGSNITWNVSSGSAIYIEDGIGRVIRSTVEKTVTITQTVSLNEVSETITHTLTVPVMDEVKNVNKYFIAYVYGESSTSNYMVEHIVDGSVVEVVNQNSFINVYSSINNNNILNVEIYCAGLPDGIDTSEFALQIKIKNTETDEVYEQINVIINTYQSVYPND